MSLYSTHVLPIVLPSVIVLYTVLICCVGLAFSGHPLRPVLQCYQCIGSFLLEYRRILLLLFVVESYCLCRFASSI
jgi:hypothetical protein